MSGRPTPNPDDRTFIEVAVAGVPMPPRREMPGTSLASGPSGSSRLPRSCASWRSGRTAPLDSARPSSWLSADSTGVAFPSRRDGGAHRLYHRYMLLRLAVAAVLAGHLSSPARAESTPGDALPLVFVDKGACPFECCTYRAWTVKADTRLYDRPGGKKLKGVLKKGERVSGVTGEVHVKPQRVLVLRDYERFKKGEYFYLLTYLGEGAYRIWYKGALSEEEPDFTFRGTPPCARSKDGCWGKPEGKYESTWWVMVRSDSGMQGWSNQPDHFGNKDACD